MKVAIVIHQGVEVLDFAGPGEVFAATEIDGQFPFEVFTVASGKEPILSQGFLKVIPNYDIHDCPQPNILVIPGGGSENLLGDAAMMAWLAATAPSADHVLTVCTGAFALARTGLLDGKQATTWHGAIDRLRKAFPKVTVHEDTRWVDNGPFVTTAGVSAGIDGALHLLGRLMGEHVAVATARYMEYDKWVPNSGLVTAAAAVR